MVKLNRGGFIWWLLNEDIGRVVLGFLALVILMEATLILTHSKRPRPHRELCPPVALGR
jgi:hypothetical protein